MKSNSLMEEIMSKVRRKTEVADHLHLTPDQYNAVYSAIDEWISEGGEKIRNMYVMSRLKSKYNI